MEAGKVEPGGHRRKVRVTLGVLGFLGMSAHIARYKDCQLTHSGLITSSSFSETSLQILHASAQFTGPATTHSLIVPSVIPATSAISLAVVFRSKSTQVKYKTPAAIE